jgi:hypothetical protein
MLKPVAKGSVSNMDPIITKKPARKKTDVQGNTGTQASKTPDNKVPR